MNCALCGGEESGRMVNPFVRRGPVHASCFDAYDRASEADEMWLSAIEGPEVEPGPRRKADVVPAPKRGHHKPHTPEARRKIAAALRARRAA